VRWLSQSVNQPKLVRQLLILFLHDSTALVGLDPLITEVSRSHSDISHWVGLLWTGDRTVVDNTKHLQEKDINALGGIPTRSPSKRAAANARLRPQDYWDRQLLNSEANYFQPASHTVQSLQKTDSFVQ